MVNRYALLSGVSQVGVIGGTMRGESLTMVQRLFILFSSSSSPSLFDGHLAALFRRHFSNAKVNHKTPHIISYLHKVNDKDVYSFPG